MTPAPRSPRPIAVEISWPDVVAVSKTTPTVAMIPYPILRHGTPVAERLWEALADLDARCVRYMLWHPYPGLSVPELEPPTADSTSWDFSVIDPEMLRLLEITKGRDPVVTPATIPQWMYVTDERVGYPADPDAGLTGAPYEQGTELVDPTGRQVAEHFARFFSWYAAGGFTDELGVRHESGHHYEFAYWGVLNEVQAEHQTTPEDYVILYDAIVSAIRPLSPSTRFVGPGLAPMGMLNGSKSATAPEPRFFEYVLDPANHRDGITLDVLSYHFYASAAPSQTIESWQYTFFDQADGFLDCVRLIEAVRLRLSPSTEVHLDELGILLPEDLTDDITNFALTGDDPDVPEAYWNLYGALYAHLFIELTRIGIDVVGLSEFINDPRPVWGHQPSVSLMNWHTGEPRASFRVLKLIRDNIGPGDRLVRTKTSRAPIPDITVQAFETDDGPKVLLVNKRDYPVAVSVTPAQGPRILTVVDVTTGEAPPRVVEVTGEVVELAPFAVGILRPAPPAG